MYKRLWFSRWVVEWFSRNGGTTTIVLDTALPPTTVVWHPTLTDDAVAEIEGAVVEKVTTETGATEVVTALLVVVKTIWITIVGFDTIAAVVIGTEPTTLPTDPTVTGLPEIKISFYEEELHPLYCFNCIASIVLLSLIYLLRQEKE